MRSLRVIGCSLLALALGACSTVTTVEPFGMEVAELDPDDWDGTWQAIGDCEPCEVKLTAKGKGILRASWTEEEDGVEKTHTGDFHFREVKDSLFASFLGSDLEEDEEKQEEEPYLWVMIQMRADDDNEDPVVIAWAPDAEKFVGLVAAGKLPGTVDEGDYTTDVKLGKLSAAHCELIASEQEGVLFLWTEPLLYRRIANE